MQSISLNNQLPILKSAERKILSFFIVDPDYHVPDTSNVEVNHRVNYHDTLSCHLPTVLVQLVISYTLNEEETERQFQEFCHQRERPSESEESESNDSEDGIYEERHHCNMD